MRVRLTELHRTLRDAGQPGHHHLRHARPGRGHDHGRAHLRAEGRRDPAGRHPTTLYERPANAFVAGFIGSPEMNLLPARLWTRSACSWASVQLPLPAPRTPPPGLPASAAASACGPSTWACCRATQATAWRCRRTLRFTEHMGNEVFVHLTLGGAAADRPRAAESSQALHGPRAAPRSPAPADGAGALVRMPTMAARCGPDRGRSACVALPALPWRAAAVQPRDALRFVVGRRGRHEATLKAVAAFERATPACA
jgi:hypothetical protein